MKKLFLLLLMVGAGSTIQAQEDWSRMTEIFDQVYSLATDLNEQTEKVTAQGSVISIVTGKGTVSVERKLDPKKAKELKHYQYNLLTSAGKVVVLDKMNAERVIETFQSKLLKLKEELRVNQDADVENILNSLFN
ncbi:hypothetical protein SAMN04487910_1349 [Aquimarina amphilecti]|uniref:Uncharacterized protein n=1 Tax=Aquimarina amphilecti TaxID=1038014 RepID=A0A1H7KM75_AQUAM|nr:hypothetical protein [Aquimarina amphilecti]SEK87115.1 hypothetical protein SAMN04487910_1349 [Aquimarina amphilecti]